MTSGTTVGQLRDRGALGSSKGRLLGVDGSVLLDDGGFEPAIARNGSRARATDRVFAGDVIVSARGADRRESVVVTDEPVPFRTRFEGRGPLTEIRVLGAPGLARVTRGAKSGAEVTSTVVLAPTDMVISRSRPSGKVVALTFDDGPWPGYTERILKVLKERNVRATFFMVGRQARRNPVLARRVAKAGHEIGSHSYSHPAFAKISEGEVRKQVKSGRRAVERATGQATIWFRPPYGSMDAAAWREVRDLDVHAVFWDVDSRDWTKPGAKRIEDSVVAHVRPGSVVLFHDGGGNRAQTAKALRGVIDRLKARGYQFVTVEELYQLRAQARAEKKAAARRAAARKKAASESRSSS